MSVLCNYFLSSPLFKPVVEFATYRHNTLDGGLCSAVLNTLPSTFPNMKNNGNNTSIDFPKYRENV